IVDIAISAPARSIEAQATSISRLRITSRMETLCTSTSYIDFSRVSGSMPCDIVRLPCGSMSTHSTRWPSSAKATARFSVVVVLATPPFWLANVITFVTGGSDGSGTYGACIRKPWAESFSCSRPAHARVGRRAHVPAGAGPHAARPQYVREVLLDKRLIFVTGKGGVGKSTVAVALGVVAARRGLRTIVAEVASQ